MGNSLIYSLQGKNYQWDQLRSWLRNALVVTILIVNPFLFRDKWRQVKQGITLLPEGIPCLFALRVGLVSSLRGNLF